ncbi:MAG: hypothetical protein R2844_14060 [Caldilineales bacterium]
MPRLRPGDAGQHVCPRRRLPSPCSPARYFQGQLEYLTTVKETLEKEGERRGREETTDISLSPLTHSPTPPVLRKDFIYDPYQIVEKLGWRGPALLLIVAVLGDNELRSLLAETRRYGMEALVEVHDEEEVERALAAGAQVIGVNNRDLRTFNVDIATTARLRPLIPADRVLVSEAASTPRPTCAG